MKEIKFRAWQTDVLENGPYMVHAHDVADWYVKELNSGGTIAVMQYTGLKDKNGTDIYEGDILSSEHYNNNPWVVEWDGEYAGFEAIGASDSEDLYDGFTQIREVIGNVYENPELLGGDRE